LTLIDILSISGWIIGAVSFAYAIYEHYDKKRIEKTIDEQKRSSFLENLKKTLSVFLPDFPEFGINNAIKSVGGRYILDYLKATNIEDPSNLLAVWEKTAVELGSTIQKQAQKNCQAPSGLAEYITFHFLSHYSKDRAREYLNSLSVNKDTEENFARYCISFTQSPGNIAELIKNFKACSREQISGVLATLKGEELKRVVDLLATQKWNRRVIERIREYVRVREVSYNSLVNKMIETNPAPRLFIIFKNEGTDPEAEDEESSLRPVSRKLRELRNSEKADLISPMTSIYFLKDNSTMEDLLKALPEGVENNYVLFAGEVDPLSIKVRTSDRLEGHPMKLYMNLQKFRDLKNIYETIILKLGLKPSEIIETADIGFLVEPKTDELSKDLRKHSKLILEELTKYSNKKFSTLTDLRNLDEDDIGYLGSLIAKNCGLQKSEGRDISKQIHDEAKELYKAIYEPLE
jgi:hypothetical protein